MQIDVLTLFPEVFAGFCNTSIIGRARQAGVVDFGFTNIRDFTHDAHRSVDDKPFGGGPGMVMSCGPVFEAWEHVQASGVGCASDDGDASDDGVDADDGSGQDTGRVGQDDNPFLIMLCPQGQPLTQRIAEELATHSWLVLLCGHYEGFDERIREGLSPREISVGDYVLSGGETAAFVVIDAVVRLLPGALGCDESPLDESFSQGLLEYPQYTRPRAYRGMSVPDVLISGDHAKIAAWRAEQALSRTRQRRPDLLEGLGH